MVFWASRVIQVRISSAKYYFLPFFKGTNQGVLSNKQISSRKERPQTQGDKADFVGLDTLLYIANYPYSELGDPRYAPPLIIKKLVKSGFIGNPRVKAGSKGGFYEYYNIPRE